MTPVERLIEHFPHALRTRIQAIYASRGPDSPKSLFDETLDASAALMASERVGGKLSKVVLEHWKPVVDAARLETMAEQAHASDGSWPPGALEMLTERRSARAAAVGDLDAWAAGGTVAREEGKT